MPSERTTTLTSNGTSTAEIASGLQRGAMPTIHRASG